MALYVFIFPRCLYSVYTTHTSILLFFNQKIGSNLSMTNVFSVFLYCLPCPWVLCRRWFPHLSLFGYCASFWVFFLIVFLLSFLQLLSYVIRNHVLVCALLMYIFFFLAYLSINVHFSSIVFYLTSSFVILSESNLFFASFSNTTFLETRTYPFIFIYCPYLISI